MQTQTWTSRLLSSDRVLSVLLKRLLDYADCIWVFHQCRQRTRLIKEEVCAQHIPFPSQAV